MHSLANHTRHQRSRHNDRREHRHPAWDALFGAAVFVTAAAAAVAAIYALGALMFEAAISNAL